MRKMVLLLLAAALLLAGCGGNESTEDVTNLEFRKNGFILSPYRPVLKRRAVIKREQIGFSHGRQREENELNFQQREESCENRVIASAADFRVCLCFRSGHLFHSPEKTGNTAFL